MKRTSPPPRLGLAIARWIAPAGRRAEVEGDLIEQWVRRHAAGRIDLRRAFWRDVLSLTQPAARRIPSRQLSPSVPVWRPTHMLNDLRFAARLAIRQPMFTLLMLLTLTIGIGASTAIFSISDRVLLKPLPYPSPERIVRIDNVALSFADNRMDIAKSVKTSAAFSSVGQFVAGGLNLGDEGLAIRLRAASASAGFFSTLGVTPASGRTFSIEDERTMAHVAILSHSVWQTHFGRRGDVVGREIRLNSRPFTVIGVMPEGFAFPQRTEIWVPPGADPQLAGAAWSIDAIARLAPHVTEHDAEAALARITEASMAARPGVDHAPMTLLPLQESLVTGNRPTLLLLTGVVGLLLLTAAANVAGLFLSRMRGRHREIVVRAALGASRSRIIRQIFAESLALAVTAGVAGLLLAKWAIAAFNTAAPDFAPNVDLVTVDMRFIGTALAVMVVTAVLFAVGPALSAAGVSASGALRSSRGATDGSRLMRMVLVTAQIGMALVLLTLSGAVLRSVLTLMRVDVGFHNDRAVAFEITLPASHYATKEAIVDVTGRLVDALRSVPGVAHAGASSVAPASPGLGIGIALQKADDPAPPGTAKRFASLLTATPDYFAAMGAPLLAGRAFTANDRAGGPPVVILSEAAARWLWASPAEAVGQRLNSKLFAAPFAPTVVGVVADLRFKGVTDTRPVMQIFVPFSQQPPYGSMSLVADATMAPQQVLPALQAAITRVDPDLPVYNTIFIRDLSARFLATERLTMWLTTAFSSVALLLCTIGLYGVLTQLVEQRVREIGIRMALGADHGRIRASIVWAGLRVAIAGVLIGLAASAGAGKAAASVVPGLAAPSVPIALAEAGVLLAVAALAAWLPARRASSVDPVVALRAD